MTVATARLDLWPLKTIGEVYLPVYGRTNVNQDSSKFIVSAADGVRPLESITLMRERGHSTVARVAVNFLSIVFFHGLVTSVSSKLGHLPDIMVIAHGAELPTLKEQPSIPHESRTEQDEASADFECEKAKNRR